MHPYFLNPSLPEVEFNSIVKELHQNSLGQPELRTSKVGRDVTKYPVPECMCNDSHNDSQSKIQCQSFWYKNITWKRILKRGSKQYFWQTCTILIPQKLLGGYFKETIVLKSNILKSLNVSQSPQVYTHYSLICTQFRFHLIH